MDIKNLLNMATAGQEAAKQLEGQINLFGKVMDMGIKNTTGEDQIVMQQMNADAKKILAHAQKGDMAKVNDLVKKMEDKYGRSSNR